MLPSPGRHPRCRLDRGLRCDGLAARRGRCRRERVPGAEAPVRIDRRLDLLEPRERLGADRVADGDVLLGEVEVRLAARPGASASLIASIRLSIASAAPGPIGTPTEKNAKEPSSEPSAPAPGRRSRSVPPSCRSSTITSGESVPGPAVSTIASTASASRSSTRKPSPLPGIGGSGSMWSRISAAGGTGRTCRSRGRARGTGPGSRSPPPRCRARRRR